MQYNLPQAQVVIRLAAPLLLWHHTVPPLKLLPSQKGSTGVPEVQNYHASVYYYEKKPYPRQATPKGN